MSELELLADCLKRLNEIGIDYYVTGSMASNFWGIPRTRVFATLSIQCDRHQVGAQSGFLDAHAKTAFDQEMLSRRVPDVVMGMKAWFASAEDVILHKLIWNRISPSDRQMRDAAGVWAVQKNALDREYLRHWAGELGITEDLRKITSREILPKAT